MFVVVLTAALAFGALGQPVHAQRDPTDQVVQQLQSQGYSRITIRRTFLGRIRIEAERPGRSREIILNGRTGEVLRDFVEAESGDGRRNERSGNSGRGSASGGSDDDDDDDDRSGRGGGGRDDDDRDDRDDDRDDDDDDDDDSDDDDGDDDDDDDDD